MKINDVLFYENMANQNQIYEHLIACKDCFIPPLSNLVDIKQYSEKLRINAYTFEAWKDDILVGLIAVYCNDFVNKIAFITNVSVMKEYIGQGIAKQLIINAIYRLSEIGFYFIKLEVNEDNKNAIFLYKKFHFTELSRSNSTIKMVYNFK